MQCLCERPAICGIKFQLGFFMGDLSFETVQAEHDSNIILIPQSQKHLELVEGTKPTHKGVN